MPGGTVRTEMQFAGLSNAKQSAFSDPDLGAWRWRQDKSNRKLLSISAGMLCKGRNTLTT